jgi:hypothetical protein
MTEKVSRGPQQRIPKCVVTYGCPRRQIAMVRTGWFASLAEGSRSGQAAEATGDTATARAQYTRLIEMWKSADPDRPELQTARRFLQSASR